MWAMIAMACLMLLDPAIASAGANVSDQIAAASGIDYRTTTISITPEIIEHERAIYLSTDPVSIEPTSTRVKHVELLKYLPDTNPRERYQGECGNCWVWAGTACLEVSLAKAKGIRDRLSIQYFDSNYNNGKNCYSCCGGGMDDFASFYSYRRIAIPWSNSNAYYADGGRCCWRGLCSHGDRDCDRSSSQIATPTSSISIDRRYTIKSIILEKVQTRKTLGEKVIDRTMTDQKAIRNIKSVIDQGKAIFFGYRWGDDKDERFMDFWKNQNEEKNL